MYKKNATLVIIIIAGILTFVYAYFSYYHTFYGLGIFLTPLVLLISVIMAFTSGLLNHQWKGSFWLQFSSITCVLFSGLLIVIAADNYKPSYYIHVPENFEGMVYLLPGKEPADELYIDENGMGYFNTGGDVHVKVKQGKIDISDALNQYGRRTLIFKLADSLHYRALEITCFEVVHGRNYGSSPWNQPHATCMDEQAFIRLLQSGAIDSSRLVQTVYPVNHK